MIAFLSTGTGCGVFFDVLAAEAIHIGYGFKGGSSQKRARGAGRRGILREGDGK
jgi:hypothetical protein